MAGISLTTMIVLNIWTKGFGKMFCVLIGMMGRLRRERRARRTRNRRPGAAEGLGAFRVPEIEHLSWKFDSVLLAPFAVAALAATLRVMGDVSNAQRLNDADWVRPNFASLTGAVAANGVASAFCGLVGSPGINSYSTSIGLAGATGITSRSVGFAAGGAFAVLSLVPVAGATLVAMPPPVIGAVLFFVSAFIFTSGLQMITARMLDPRKTIVIGFSFAIAMMADIYRDVFAGAPPFLKPILDNSLVLGTVCRRPAEHDHAHRRAAARATGARAGAAQSGDRGAVPVRERRPLGGAARRRQPGGVRRRAGDRGDRVTARRRRDQGLVRRVQSRCAHPLSRQPDYHPRDAGPRPGKSSPARMASGCSRAICCAEAPTASAAARRATGRKSTCTTTTDARASPAAVPAAAREPARRRERHLRLPDSQSPRISAISSSADGIAARSPSARMLSASARLSWCSATMRSSTRALGHQPVDGDRPRLADAMRAAHRLILGRGVPPRVGDHHVVGGGQVEPEAAGLEADQEQVALAGLERGDAARALAGRRGAVEILVAMPAASSGCAQEREEVDELAEHQRLVAVRRQLGGELGERLHLGADDAELGADEARIARRAAQPGELREDVEAAPARAARVGSARSRRRPPPPGAAPRSARPRPAPARSRGRARCAAAAPAAPATWSGAARRARSAAAAAAAHRDRGRARSAPRSAR